MLSPLIAAVPVSTLRKAVEDPVTSPKLTVIRCVRPYEDEDVNWMADQVAQQITTDLEDVEVADLYLSAYRILTNVSNDPDNKRFDPKDQFPAIVGTILNSDFIVIAASESCGLPHSNVVRMCERLHQHVEENTEKGADKVAFNGVPCATLIHGDDFDSYAAAVTLASAMSRLGCAIVGRGIVSWNEKKGKAHKSEALSDQLSNVAVQLVNMVKGK